MEIQGAVSRYGRTPVDIRVLEFLIVRGAGLTAATAAVGVKLSVSASPPRRNQSIEALRVLSCFGIAAFHEHVAGWEVCYAGLTVFLILTAYFEASAAKPTDPLALARKLLLPWGGATIIFGGLNLLRLKPVLPGGHSVLGLLYGTSAHLWYLPFAFACLAGLGALRTHRRGLLYGASVAALLMLLTCALWRRAALPAPLPQYLQATGPLCIGVLLAMLRTSREARFIAVAVGAAWIFAVAAHVGGVSIPYGVGTAAVVLALLFPIRWNVQPVSRHMFGVYLIHPALLTLAHLKNVHGWAAASFAFFGSLALVWAYAWVDAEARGPRPSAVTPATPGR